MLHAALTSALLIVKTERDRVDTRRYRIQSGTHAKDTADGVSEYISNIAYDHLITDLTPYFVTTRERTISSS
jgi:hypothetical protein